MDRSVHWSSERLIALAIAIAVMLGMASLPIHDGVEVLGRQSGRSVLHVSQSGSAEGTGSAERPFRELQQAVDASTGPTLILVGSGNYEAVHIDKRSDLEIQGAGRPVIRDGAYDRRAGLRVVSSSRVEITGLDVRQSLVGVLVEASSGITLRDLAVSDIGQEGIHVRHGSSAVLIADSSIAGTGRRPGADDRFPYSKYGEGIYIGTGTGDPDFTRDVVIRNNEIRETSAEAVDIKPRTSDIVVEWNDIHDIETNTSGAVVVGIGPLEYGDPSVIIRHNLIWNISTSSPYSDGNAITVSAPATISSNVIIATEHFGILTDGNFGTSRDVEIVGNVIMDTGRDPIGSWTEPSGASVSRDGNVTGTDAAAELGTEPIVGGLPTSAVYEVRASLGSSPSTTTTAATGSPSTATSVPVTTVATSETSPLSVTTLESTTTGGPTTSSTTTQRRSETSVSTPLAAGSSDVPPDDIEVEADASPSSEERSSERDSSGGVGLTSTTSTLTGVVVVEGATAPDAPAGVTSTSNAAAPEVLALQAQPGGSPRTVAPWLGLAGLLLTLAAGVEFRRRP